MRLILGSASPRRLELLAQIGVVPDDVRSPDTDETPTKNELPLTYCRRMAAQKAASIPTESGDLVLAADTTVAVGRRILGKPQTEAEARAFLTLLSGRRHTVITAIALNSRDRSWAREVSTVVQFKRLQPSEIDAYISCGEWRGKAGGYGIQGHASALIPRINGSFSAVVGLPLAETATLLRAAGFDRIGAQS